MQQAIIKRDQKCHLQLMETKKYKCRPLVGTWQQHLTTSTSSNDISLFFKLTSCCGALSCYLCWVVPWSTTQLPMPPLAEIRNSSSGHCSSKS